MATRVHDVSQYDFDEEALAWARSRVKYYVKRCQERAVMCAKAGNAKRADEWQMRARLLHNAFIGGEGTVIAAFDYRRPEFEMVLAGQEVDDGGG